MTQKKCSFHLTFVFLLTFGFVGNSLAVDIAKVNGRAITDSDIRQSLSALNEGSKETLLKNEKHRKQILDQLIDQELIAQAAEKEKLNETAQFNLAVKAFSKNFLTRSWIEKNISSQLTNSNLKNYYSVNKHKYTSDQVRVQHILLNDENAAREIMRRAKSNSDFLSLAEQSSKDPSVTVNRGDVGWMNWNSPFVQEFKQAAISAKLNEVVGPVQTAYGYHVLKVTERRPGVLLEFAEVEAQVLTDFQNDLIRNFLAKSRLNSKLTIDDAALVSFK